MITSCKILNLIDEDTVEIEIQSHPLVCFSNLGIKDTVGSSVIAELSIFDDIIIRESEDKFMYIEKGPSFYSYIFNGVLSVDDAKLYSLITLELDPEDLYDYGYLHEKYVKAIVARIDFSLI